MKIYDISQEVFGCQVYPGDPTPKKRVISSMEKGDLYNLTAFSMCAHNGTHIDAPFHFIKDGKTVDSVSLNTFIGMAYVAEYNGIVSADDATEILEKAKKQNSEAAKREMQRSLRKQLKCLLNQTFYCLVMNLKLSVLKMLRWKYTLSY